MDLDLIADAQCCCLTPDQIDLTGRGNEFRSGPRVVKPANFRGTAEGIQHEDMILKPMKLAQQPQQ